MTGNIKYCQRWRAYIAGESVKWCNFFGKHFGMYLSYDPAIPLKYLLKRIENIQHTKVFYTNVHYS